MSTESNQRESGTPAPCPNCGSPLPVQAEFCPGCHQYLFDDDFAAWVNRPPPWYVIVLLIGIVLGILLYQILP